VQKNNTFTSYIISKLGQNPRSDSLYRRLCCFSCCLFVAECVNVRARVRLLTW